MTFCGEQINDNKTMGDFLTSFKTHIMNPVHNLCDLHFQRQIKTSFMPSGLVVKLMVMRVNLICDNISFSFSAI